MLASNQAMFIAWGPQRTFLYNDAYAQILASKHPAALGRDFLDAWAEIRSDLVPIVDQAYRGEPVHMEDIELQMNRKGFQEEAHFSFSYTPIRDEQGQVAGFLCACVEITDQVLADRRRVAENDRLSRMFSQAPGFRAMLSGPEHRIVMTNPAYMQLVGHRDVLGKTVSETLQDAVAQGYLDLLDQVFARNEAYETHGANYRVQAFPGGAVEDRYVDFVYQPVTDGEGNVTGIFVDGVDVTDRVLNERRQKFRLQLEDRLRGLTEPGAIVQATVELLGKYLDADRVGYGEIIGDRLVRTTGSYTTDGMTPLTEDYLLDEFGPARIESQRRGDIVVIQDIQADSTSAEPVWAALDTRGVVSVPLVRDGRFVAALYVNTRLPRLWSPDDVSLIQEVANRSWDAGQRAIAEMALRDSEVQFRLMANAVPQIVWITDDEGHVEFMNKQWFDYIGQQLVPPSSDALIETYVHPGDQKATFAVLAETRRTGAPFSIEHRLRGGTGQYRWFLARGEPHLDDASGKVLRWFASSVDIHDRKLAEEELRRFNEQLEQRVAERTAERDRLWTLSQDMFAQANLEGMMSAVSPAWTKILGWSESELTSRPYATFMHHEDMEPTLAALASMGESGQPTRFENRIATKDGDWKWIEWTVAPEPDGQNFIAVGRDLSAAKVREHELASAQEALRQAQKMEAVGQLTGGLAHDFNNILAGISGSLEMMTSRLAQGRIGELDRYIDGASVAAKRAANLTQRLLAFSRRQTLEPKPANLNNLVAGMLELIHRSVGPGIEVEAVSGTGLWPTFVDVGQLENALLNLCINARDAMPEGGKLTIETANRWMDETSAKRHNLDAGQYVSLCVSDTGTGMTPDVVDRAFDPFYTTKPIGEGTGLGLSMVYGFAGQSGGTARIHSEVDRGTTLCLYLPRHLGNADPVELTEHLPEPTRADENETVLLVDDEPLIRMIAAEALQELDYTVIEAYDGASALKVLNSTQKIDLLITDVGLPGGMNGRQIADAARESRPELRVLFVTGYAEKAVLNHGHLETGMQILTKPFQMDQLGRKVRELIEQ